MSEPHFNWASVVMATTISCVIAMGKKNPLLGSKAADLMSRRNWWITGVVVAVVSAVLTAWTLKNCG